MSDDCMMTMSPSSDDMLKLRQDLQYTRQCIDKLILRLWALLFPKKLLFKVHYPFRCMK